MIRASKVELETRLAIGLLAVFLISLGLGPLKSLGRSAAGARGAGKVVSGLQALGSRVEVPRQHTPPAVAIDPNVGMPRALDTSMAQGYTAFELRDPLASLLPPELAQAPAEAARAARAQAPMPKPSPSAVRLQGILWGQDGARAIINDHVYGIGDRLDNGAVITAIDRTGVMVDIGGEVQLLALQRREGVP